MKLLRLAIRTLKTGYVQFRLMCWKINRLFRKSVTVSTRQGVFTVRLGAEESIGRSLYCKRKYELDFMLQTMALLRGEHKCPPKGEGAIIDVGANIGVTSIGMLYTGELKNAVAIEPEPQNFSLLQRNVNTNKLNDKIICLPYAASHQKGELQFELSNTNFGDHRVRAITHAPGSAEQFGESERRVITVKADQLDNLLAELPESFTRDIAVIWVDVQGHEGYVFMGAAKLLAKGIPVVSEIWPYGIKRAGMTHEQFYGIARSIWSNYWVLRRGTFVCYPVSTLDVFFDELGNAGGHRNVIFTK